MKIIGLKVDGIRKLKAIEMKFSNKGLIQIKGKNGQGKTSILDSLEILLKGKSKIEKDMIQHGKDKAKIVGHLGDYEVTRVITGKTQSLKIKNKDGLLISEKPEAFLSNLINSLTFDPRPFLDKKPEGKLRAMMDVLGINFESIDNDIEKLVSERLYTGRDLKNFEKLAPVAKEERVDISELLRFKSEAEARNNLLREQQQKEKEEAVEKIYEFNHEQEKRAIVIKRIKDERNILTDKRDDLLKRLNEVDADIANNHQEFKERIVPEPLKRVEDIILAKPEYEDTECFTNQISKAEKTNRAADNYERYIENRDKRDSLQEAYDDYSDKIDNLRAKKLDILANTEMPIEGLEIREDGVYHNGVFSENWGEAEGLRLSAELCIAMSPELRAIFIDKGEAYDKSSLKELEKWANDNDIQAFITRVEDIKGEKSEEGVFYIEEGNLI